MIIEQTDLEQELEALKLALEESEQDKMALLRSVSHDIKAPLNQLYALSSLLSMTGDNLTEEQKEYVDRMEIVVREGLTLIRNLLDLREVDYREVKFREEDVDIKQVLEKVVAELSSTASRKKVRVECKLIPIHSRLDNVYTARVFDNLVSNAIKYSPHEGVVKIDLTIEGDELVLTVSDQGEGIPASEQHLLFKKFSILSPKPTAGENTSGIGLYVAQKMAQGMNGSIRFLAGDPETTFQARLPIR